MALNVATVAGVAAMIARAIPRGTGHRHVDGPAARLLGLMVGYYDRVAAGEDPDHDAEHQRRRAAVRRAGPGLADAGHEVVLSAPHRFHGFARNRGVTFDGIDDGPIRLPDRHQTPTPGSGKVRNRRRFGRRRRQIQAHRRGPPVEPDCQVVGEPGGQTGALSRQRPRCSPVAAPFYTFTDIAGRRTGEEVIWP